MEKISGGKVLVRNFFDYWALHWRTLGNFYRNQLPKIPGESADAQTIGEIYKLCQEMSSEIEKAFGRFGRPKLENIDTRILGELMGTIAALDAQIENEDNDSRRLKILTRITFRILSGDTRGLMIDAAGNFPDWYAEIR